MPRTLDTVTLDGAAEYYAGTFMMNRGRFNRDWVVGQFGRFDFDDEFEYLIDGVRDQLGSKSRNDFDARIGKLLKDKPRDRKVFEKKLADKLAITPDGEHIEGRIGTTVLHGSRFIGMHDVEVETPESIAWRRANNIPQGKYRKTMMRRVPLYWPIYAGEPEERMRPGGGAADPLPEGTPGLPVGAQVFTMCASAAVAMLDALVDSLDEGTGSAIIQGRSGAQPADPDAAATGTLGFTLVCSATAFGAAADQADGSVQASAAAITDDSSADATITLSYCRAASSNDGATSLDDKIDGEAGTSGADFNFNTLSIVAGANVSMSSWAITLSQGATAA